ncbi:SRPBCC domain-containing protein [Mucilaginibacter corticis]|uniref:SRPBCC domain-containing protein n=1 Tax=Mucilaginibacter corticis TaxID=2597670 RepID=A0A556M9I9_9SPHI|nr:SRPBCC domain-containing protein [Mucilaginibacter corticis]TSJ36516.1 SRPBCC domain-containing protein [Mucilaginibacter corticis]
MEENFSTSITVPLHAAAALEKICQVPAWWGVTIEGPTEKLDDQFVIRMGQEAYFNCAITELIPGKRVVWSVGDCFMPWYEDKTEWSGTLMIFDLDESGSETEISFTHEGITPESECYKDCQPGWTHWIRNSLFSYLTTGKGDFKQR